LTGVFVFPDFSDRCLICGLPGCARRNGFYLRKRGNVKVVTFECQNPPPGRHRTFSLLPWPLVPYRHRGVDFLVFLVKARDGGRATYLEATSSVEAELGLAVSLMGSLYGWMEMAKIAALKWDDFKNEQRGSQTLADMEFDALAEACVVYTRETEDFLFGVPSQHRPANHCRSP
jgi:hypothetical protein